MIGSLLAPYCADDFNSENATVNNNYGWIICVLILFNVFINQMAMIISVLHKIIETFKKYIKKCKKCLKKRQAAKKQ